MSARVASRPAAHAGQRSVERLGVVHDPDAGRDRGGGSGRSDHDDLGREPPAGVDRVVEQWAAVDGLGELVPAEAR